MTLTDTARLRRSFAVEVSDDKVAVGTSVVYAGTHQFGAKKGSFGIKAVAVKAHRRINGSDVRAHTRRVSLPWGDIPARPFLMLQDEDKSAIVEMIAKKLEV
jgi:phage gpG-like protein